MEKNTSKKNDERIELVRVQCRNCGTVVDGTPPYIHCACGIVIHAVKPSAPNVEDLKHFKPWYADAP